jgi:hypothetical protein
LKEKIQTQKNEGVDGFQKVLHNLISLLQTKRFAARNEITGKNGR